MALRACKECGNQVSTKAATCPKCGAPIKPKGGTQVSTGTGCLVILILVGVIGYFASDTTDTTRSTNRSTSQSSTATYYADTTVNVRAGPSLDAAVITQLHSGDSVQVRSESGGWGQISRDGKTGYVYLEVLSKSAPSSRQPQISAAERNRFRELRDDGIRLIGWVAGNARNHPIWPQVRGFVGEGGTYYEALVQMAAPGEDHKAAAYANVSLYREWVERGRQEPFNESEAVSRIERTNQIVEELTTLMRRW